MVLGLVSGRWRPLGQLDRFGAVV